MCGLSGLDMLVRKKGVLLLCRHLSVWVKFGDKKKASDAPMGEAFKFFD